MLDLGTNLMGADLRGADLHDADLRWANLSRTDLSSADLSDADLTGANLSDANLVKTNMSGAILEQTALNRANLHEADLRSAHLGGADLHSADLSGADLDTAIVDYTRFNNVDLSKAEHLEAVSHRGPSSVGVDTLFKSKGKIPEGFLRGCGVPDVLIDYLPTLINSMQPIQFYSCFISYSGKDNAFARRLRDRLRAEGLRVWFAPEDMRGGKKSRNQIDDAIRLYDRLLPVLSEDSMKSEEVRHEIKRAREKERDTGKEVLFPIGLIPFERIREWQCPNPDTGEDLAEKIREYHVPDFSNWKHEDDFEKGFAKLMENLRWEDEQQS